MFSASDRLEPQISSWDEQEGEEEEEDVRDLLQKMIFFSPH